MFKQPSKVEVIEPTVGRVVHFYPGSVLDRQPQAAIITAVHDTRCVNLAIFAPSGRTNRMTSVPLVQPGDPATDAAHARWMPYQVGQAAPTGK